MASLVPEGNPATMMKTVRNKGLTKYCARRFFTTKCIHPFLFKVHLVLTSGQGSVHAAVESSHPEDSVCPGPGSARRRPLAG